MKNNQQNFNQKNQATNLQTEGQINLLPIGFYDQIFDEAEKLYYQSNLAIDHFLANKYRLIKPSIIEFAQTYWQNANFNSQNYHNLFNLVDVFSNQNLVLRNDITPQISRIINSSLKTQNLPLKICYAGDIFLAKNSAIDHERVKTQIGIEIIHCQEENSDFEIIENIIIAVKKMLEFSQINSSKLLIELSLPQFLENLLQLFNIKLSAPLISAINCKNISQIKQEISIPDLQELIIEIALNNQNLLSLINKIQIQLKKYAINPNKIEQFIHKAQKINQFLQQNFANLTICFDLFGDDYCNYHDQFFFELFFDNLKSPIARGGRYKINSQNLAQNSYNSFQPINGVGGTIYLNNIQKITS